MLGDWSAEEFYTRCVSDAATLHAAAQQFARPQGRDADVVAALACALGSDVAILEAVVWERINIAPRTPQQQFFEVAEAVTGQLVAAAGDGPTPSMLFEVVDASRTATMATFDDSMARELDTRWHGIGYLRDVAAPTSADLAASVDQRLDGHTPEAFVTACRGAAAEAMAEAIDLLAASHADQAIRAAFTSDQRTIDAYLVESAVAVGDHALLSVVTRGALIERALAVVSTLPEGFAEAIAQIRATTTGALGAADAARLRAVLLPVAS